MPATAIPAATARTLSILDILAGGQMLRVHDDKLLAMKADMSLGIVKWVDGKASIGIPLTLKQVNFLLSEYAIEADGRRPIT